MIKKAFRKIGHLTLHFSFILSVYLIVLIILNDYNPGMNLLGNIYTLTILTIYCVCNILHFINTHFIKAT